MELHMTEHKPLVSVIVPTRNNQQTIAACLESIHLQTYQNIEIIVVDNFSTDLTFAIASRYEKQIYRHGDERCEQANFGASVAKGEYILRMDADLVLDPQVVEQCVDVALTGCDAVEVHNSPDPSISWIAAARRFEYDLLRGDPKRISARFVKRDLYLQVGGLDPTLIAGEDYDFQNRINREGVSVGFIESQAVSISEPTSIIRMVGKHFRYGRQAVQYHVITNGGTTGQLDTTSIVEKLYVRKWRRYLESPILSLKFLVYYSVKLGAGGSGFMFERLVRKVHG
jgi:glycosyltransferase involved in cell wall biosynthesis